MNYVEKEHFLKLFFTEQTTIHITSIARVVCERGYWQVPRRTIQDHLIYLCEDGSFNLWTEGGTCLLRPNELFWCQPEVESHFTLPDGVDKATVIFCRFFIADGDSLIRLEKPFFHTPSQRYHQDLMMKLYGTHINNNHINRSENARIYLPPILDDMINSSDMCKKVGGLQPHLKKMLAIYVQEHIREPIGARDLAKLCGYNQAHFSRQFRLRFGMSPTEYITRTRINVACNLLKEPGMNISEVAEYLGYGDLFFFSKQFKKYKGASPKNWLASLHF